MSRGPGRIERAIRELFDAHPDEAFVTDELVEHCYPDARPIEQKHRVAVLRAVRNVLKHDPDWRMVPSESHGGTMTFFNRASARSWALASVMGECRTIYRGSPARIRRNDRARFRGGFFSRVIENQEDAIARLQPHRLKRYTEHAQRHTAYRDGDAETRAAMDAQDEADRQAWLAAGNAIGAALAARRGKRKRLETVNVHRPSTLTIIDPVALAECIRALMTQNDPDAIREGLREIADALDPPAMARDAA